MTGVHMSELVRSELADEVNRLVGDVLPSPALDCAALPARVGRTVRITTATGSFLLKFVPPDERGEAEDGRRNAIRTEAEVLAAVYPQRLVRQHEGARERDYVWLLTHWLPGRSVSEPAADLRSSGLPLTPLLTDMAVAVRQLHDGGFWHGDLQPDHFLCAEGGIRLIDFDVAVPRAARSPRYGGGLVHFVAPEVARGMLAGSKHIPLTEATEVYSFGAVCHVLRTGYAPIGYQTREDAPPGRGQTTREQKLRAIAEGRLAASVTMTRRPTEQRLVELIADCLAGEPSCRPADMAAVTTRLAELAAEGAA